MKNHTLAYGLLAVVFSSFYAIGSAQSPGAANLEASFKAAFSKYRDAISSKENDKLRAALTAASYMNAKNEGISMKMSFPKDYFENKFVQMFAGIDLNEAKTLRAAENGNTGVMISFFSKSAKFNPFEPGAEGMVACVVSKYEKVGGDWKYSNSAMEGVQDEEEVALLKGDLSKFDGEKFKPSGVVEPVPAEQGPPDYDYDAFMNVNSFGYQTEITLNGKVVGKTSANLGVRTGVKKGDNTIVIKVTALDRPDIVRVKIQARKNDDAAPVEVFKIELDKPSADVTKSFVVKLE